MWAETWKTRQQVSGAEHPGRGKSKGSILEAGVFLACWGPQCGQRGPSRVTEREAMGEGSRAWELQSLRLWQELCLHSEWDGESLEHFEQRGDITWHGFWPILRFLERRSINSYLWGPLSVLEARTSPQHFWELALLQPFFSDVLGTPFLFHFSCIPTIKSPLFDFFPIGLYSSNWGRPRGQPLSLLWLPLGEKATCAAGYPSPQRGRWGDDTTTSIWDGTSLWFHKPPGSLNFYGISMWKL